MPATYPENVRQVGKLDQRHILALLTIYREAVDELRSWNDPALSVLIVRLEALRRFIARRARMSD